MTDTPKSETPETQTLGSESVPVDQDVLETPEIESPITPAREPRQLRRLPAIAAIVAILFFGTSLDGATDPAVPSDLPSVPEVLSATPANAPSSTWFCPLASLKGTSVIDSGVIVTNPTSKLLRGKAISQSTSSKQTVTPIEVPAFGRTELRTQNQSPNESAGLVVELDGGGAVAEHWSRTASAYDAASCSATTANRWWFAEGSTSKGDQLLLVLLNPFAAPAVVDTTFVAPFADGETPDKLTKVSAIDRPRDFQGLVVPANGTLVVDIGQHVRRRPNISTEVVVRKGQVAADQVQLFGKPTRGGLVVTPGAAAMSDTWYFAGGVANDGIVERFSLFNPSKEEAIALLSFSNDGEFVEPMEVRVPGRGRVTVSSADKTARIPRNASHDVVITSDSANLVAQRSIEQSAPRVESAGGIGHAERSRRWAFGTLLPSAIADIDVIRISNPTPISGSGGSAAKVSVFHLVDGKRVAIKGMQNISVRSGRRHEFNVGEVAPSEDGAFIVESTVPVVADRVLVSSAGLAAYVGIMLS